MTCNYINARALEGAANYIKLLSKAKNNSSDFTMVRGVICIIQRKTILTMVKKITAKWRLKSITAVKKTQKE